MSEWVLGFDEIGVADIATVGGKAANLGELTRAGLPVPVGFCVTAAAYRRLVESSGTKERIRESLARIERDPAAVDDAAAEIRALLTDRRFPPELRGPIGDAYRRLAAEMGGSTDGPTAVPVAVRSSATAEDLPGASFAGQQDTYLNVRGEDALLEHVQRCWASLWTTRAVAYRSRQGYAHEQVALAVAVQAMVDAEVAGVLFSANPVTSDRGEAVINASWGLGEAIVSGLVTPDTWIVRKEDEAITSRDLGHKARAVERSPDGINEVDVPAERRDIPSLSDAQIAELVAIASRIESHYGDPMDIEWAFADGRFFVLQARSITTLASETDRPRMTGAPAREPSKSIADLGDFNRTMFVEIFPDPLSPAFVSVVEPLFCEMLDFTFRSLGFRPPDGRPGVRVFYSQPYFDQRYVEATLRPLKKKTRERLVAQIVNPFGRHDRSVPVEASLPFLRMVWRLFGFMRSLPDELPREVQRYQAAIQELEMVRFEELSEAELTQRIDRLVFGAANRLLDYDFLLIALIGRTYQMIDSVLERYFGNKAEEMRARLVSGVTGNVTMETNKRMWDLAVAARRSTVVSDAIRNGDGPIKDQLSETEDGRAFLSLLDEFLTEYGHREIRMDILYPTWGEDPSPVLAFVRGYLDLGDVSDPHRQQERLVREREAVLRRVRTRLRRSLAGRLLAWPAFGWTLRHTQAVTRLRDTMHFELTRLFPPFRRLLLELGRRWTARGLIAAPEDAFFLTIDEIRRAPGSDESFHSLVDARRRDHLANRRRMPPSIIRDGEELWTETSTAAQKGDGRLRGIAGSPGRASGIVRVIHGPEGFRTLVDGEILVAPITNPVWTPLFAIAGGLVTEVGGILSHGAIVAREYGIPAVMGVSGATTSLRDGQRVVVDGSGGLVHVVGGVDHTAVTSGVAEVAGA